MQKFKQDFVLRHSVPGVTLTSLLGPQSHSPVCRPCYPQLS